MQISQIFAGRRNSNEERERINRLALAQASYFVVTGVWPLISLRSFERITGPKVDGWLVKSVGVQVGVVGGVIGLAANRRLVTPEIELLAAASAFGLGAIDVVYAARRRISPIYFADAAVQLGFIAGWAAVRRER